MKIKDFIKIDNSQARERKTARLLYLLIVIAVILASFFFFYTRHSIVDEKSSTKIESFK